MYICLYTYYKYMYIYIYIHTLEPPQVAIGSAIGSPAYVHTGKREAETEAVRFLRLERSADEN